MNSNEVQSKKYIVNFIEQVAQQISFTKCQEVVDLVDDELLGQMVKMVVKTTAGW